MELRYQLGEETIVLRVEKDGDRWRVGLPDGTERLIVASRGADGVVELQWDAMGDGVEKRIRVPIRQSGQSAELSYGGEVYRFEAIGGRQRAGRAREGKGQLAAPMVGVVADVLVAVGDAVAAYQPLAVIEAMKVYATLEAPFAGTIAAAHVKKGDRVDHGAVVVEVTPAEGTTNG